MNDERAKPEGPNPRGVFVRAAIAIVPAFGLMIWLGLLVVGLLEGAGVVITPSLTIPLNIMLLLVLWVVVFSLLRSRVRGS